MELRTRQLTLNNRSVPIQEVGGLAAVRATDRPVRGAVTVAIDREPVRVPVLALDRVARLIPGATKAELARFQDAGWYFVEAAYLPGPPDQLLASVLVDPAGHVSLAPNRVTVKFTDADADPASLFPVGVVHVTPLKFAKGLYSIVFDSKAGKDALEVAGELTSSGKVEYAEPELLAYLQGRG